MTDAWSEIAETWARLWGGFAGPVQRTIAEATGIGPGSRVLDVGCGSGEFLAYVHELGAEAVGIDSSPGMVALAKNRAPHATVRLGDVDQPLPWPDDDFDVVTAVNVLQFAEDPVKAVDEFAFMGPQVALAGWAERARNDFNAIDDALADEPTADGEFRKPGGFESLLREASLVIKVSGLVEVVWEVPDDGTLVRGILLGDDAEADIVLEAAKPFRTADGGYRLVNHFRYAVGVQT